MSNERIAQVIEALTQAGIPACRGFRPGSLPKLEAPRASVQIQEATPEGLTLAVTVYGEASLGGEICEDGAAQACQVLTDLGAQCSQGLCRYDKTSGLLESRVLAAWKAGAQPTPQGGLPCQVFLDGEEAAHLTGFSARRTVELSAVQALEAGTVFRRVEQVCWLLTVEELLPLGSEIPDDGALGFTVQAVSTAGTETYGGCYWVDIFREQTARGLRQVRKAKSWQEREVSHG